ncbi:ThiJ/PfpI domain-containing protein [Nitratireductor aquibiodomus RA22]|uniref:DJ-1/PfpI family protein n=2 Tax=Nitratireductor aquibiodomus TaxID=204799 RepID=A0A1H4KC27_9HYPH|nr:DJ-1/PfpI family protein [Nitratireductor aquibiodomus]EIM75158.1 ThiJ/PfpI domain-containing protein [Nitratireductor aquibiodomus RA22]SEB56100.1 DJ-1/PfpI family protein [Nitratireductor aquibiodomus]
MSDRKKIGFVFIENYADWEYGLLAASAVEWLGADVVALTPGAGTVTSIAGFRRAGDRGASAEENADLGAVAVIGSDRWTVADAPDVAPLLQTVGARGGVVGGICAGTLALARAGLFETRSHTSNGADWIDENLPDYKGRENYRDVPFAVCDDRVVSAPGTAPATFASAFLEAVFPDKIEMLTEFRAMMAREFQPG